MMRFTIGFGVAALLMTGLDISADPPADEYKKDRAAAEKAAAIMPALPLERADELARLAEKAANPTDAARLWRQARWRLPAVPPEMPNHLHRILGDPRWRHAGWVNAVAYNTDGSQLLSAGNDGTARLWDLGAGRLVRELRGHDDKVTAAAFLPDHRAVTAGGKTVIVWDINTGKTIHTLTGATERLKALVVQPNGQFVAAAGAERVVRVWDVRDGKAQTYTFDAGGGTVYSLAWSPNGRWLAAATGNGQLLVWDASGREPKAAIDLKLFDGDAAYAVSFAPGGKFLAVGGPRAVKLVTAPSAEGNDPGGTVARVFEGASGHTGLVTALAFSPDGKSLASAGSDRSLRLWDVASGQVTRVLVGHVAEVSAVAFRGDGHELVTGGQDCEIHFWDLLPEAAAVVANGHRGPVWSAAFSPDGTKLGTGGADRIARIWDAATGRQLRALNGHGQPVTAVVWSPDGGTLYTACGDRVVRAWDAANDAPARTLTHHQAAVLALALSGEGKLLLSGGADRKVRGWDVAAGRELFAWPGHAAAVTAVVIRPDGKMAASASADGVIKVWECPGGKEVVSFRAHDAGGVAALAWSADGRWLASAGGDKAVKNWTVASRMRDPSATLLGHHGPVSALAFHPTQPWLASTGADGSAKVWDVAERTEIQSFRGAGGWQTTAQFSTDGQRLVTAGVDGRVEVWPLRRAATASHIGHSRAVVALAGRGNRLLSAAATGKIADANVFVWDTATGQPDKTLRGLSERVVAMSVSPDGTRGLTAEENRLRLWDLATGKEVRSFEPKFAVSNVAFAGDGSSVLVWLSRASNDETVVTSAIHRVDVSSGQWQELITEKGLAVNCLGFSTDGGLAVVGRPNGTLRVWNLAAKEPLGPDVSTGHNIVDVALTSDNHWAITAGDKGDIRIWPVGAKAEQPSASPDSGIKKIAALAVHPQLPRFAVLGDNGDVAVYEATSAKQLRRWPGTNRARSITFTPDGRLAVGQSDGTVLVLDLS